MLSSLTHAPTIAPADLRDAMDSDTPPTVIDVRSGAEYSSVHIRGSYNVPLPLLAEHGDEFASRLPGQVVLICQSGNRARQANQRLESVGVDPDSVTVLDGGIAGYEAAGGEVVRGKGAWAMDRQVRMVAGSLVLVGVTASKIVSPKFAYLAGAIGAGLTYSAASNSCAMAAGLAKMPWNRSADEPGLGTVLDSLPTRS
ncbi:MULTISPECIES: rhodanese-like domain-containing protein [unclassified Dietzia]|uniref:rhodanese-like domain-containing protein n=1 Tax=unclassified Dietzia TaxID=2617939 RepID=UPI0015FC8957|nr:MULTISPECIES: rhodanese-like domain-containing protein [unclassified Dietzia]MBB1040973.1 rhodanese-like domain-containing protein [Dietzia sp. Cai40]MBB1044252.1 rhodanese-like domain-containing protein [Dietzia sp. DQ11-44]MBB1055803.1 rhodanese-like domain-containing protein [Dietzia sp. B44]